MTESNGYAQPRLDPRPAIPPRSIGPVTVATSGAVAATTVLCWVLSVNGIDVPDLVQGSISVLLALAAGFAVKPARPGTHAA